ncbi:hypothetical protein [Streptomyces sp. SJL17-4]
MSAKEKAKAKAKAEQFIGKAVQKTAHMRGKKHGGQGGRFGDPWERP